MSMRAWSMAFLVLLVRSSSAAQTPRDLPAFEVISIKPVNGETPGGGIPNSPDRFVRPAVTAAQLIEYAYEVRQFQVVGGPGWLRSDRFAVSAKAESAPPGPQMRLMVRRLLAERFGLEVHTESREMATYGLVTARRDGRLGEKMRATELDCAPIIDSGQAQNRKPGEPPTCAWFVALMNGLARLRLNGIRAARFASILEPMAMRKIVDRTNLSGTYDIDFEFLPDPGLLGLRVPNPTTSESEVAPLLTAIQDQLGLKLESERGPVPLIVIDSAQLPMPN